MAQPTERCLICGSKHRWEIDNLILAEGKTTACKRAEKLGFSSSGFYRHAKYHTSLSVDSPPIQPSPIEWSRAAINIAAAVEAYRIITDPGGIGDISILVGKDETNQYVELALTYDEGAVDLKQIDAMSYDLNLDVKDIIITSGVIPVHRMSAKLYTPQIFVGTLRSVR